MVFENWLKLEMGYPVSSLICKLQEIREIGLARQQQQRHPPFSSLATCARMRSYISSSAPPPLFRLQTTSSVFPSDSAFSLLFVPRAQFLFEKPNNLSGNAPRVIGALFPICISIYYFSILSSLLFLSRLLFLYLSLPSNP